MTGNFSFLTAVVLALLPLAGNGIAQAGQLNKVPGTGDGLPTGFEGRGESTRKKLLETGGGNAQTEAAVARGLAWLAKQQKADGRWLPDGSSKDVIAATGLAVLPFLAAGETHKKGVKYAKNVSAGLRFLRTQQKPDGSFTGSTNLYAHAIAALTMSEAYGMTQDPALKKPAQSAVDYIVKAQHAAGGWRYAPGMPGDTSVTGWQIQALRAARLAGLRVPKETLAKAGKFLDSVKSKDADGTYAYVPDAGGDTPALTAISLLCRLEMGWTARNPNLLKGVEVLKKRLSDEKQPWDAYYLFSATQTVYQVGGTAWEETWNPAMRKLLLAKQEEAGNFPADGGLLGNAGGRLLTTALAVLTLEVYYRYPPPRDGAGLKEKEKPTPAP